MQDSLGKIFGAGRTGGDNAGRDPPGMQLGECWVDAILKGKLAASSALLLPPHRCG